MDVVLPVPIGNIEGSVRRKGDAGRLELCRGGVDLRRGGIALDPHDTAFECQLGKLTPGQIGQVEELLFPFLTDDHAVRPPLPLSPHGADKCTVLLEDEDGILRVGVEVDTVLRIDLHGAVRTAERHPLWQSPPASQPFIAMGLLSDNQWGRALLLGRHRSLYG